MWGLHHASFLPSWVPVALVAALAVALMPPVAATTMPGLLALASQLRRWHRLTLPAMVLAVGLGMFLTLPMEHALLGDAAARLAEVAAERLPGSGFRPHANDTAVRHLVHHSIGVPLGWSPARSYAAISTAWCVVLLAAAWYLCGQLAAGRGASRFLLFAPLATSGYVLLFFGYIEAYSSVAALGILLLVTTLRYVQGQTGLWLPLLVWLVLAGHHALGALGGSCLVLAILRDTASTDDCPPPSPDACPGWFPWFAAWLHGHSSCGYAPHRRSRCSRPTPHPVHLARPGAPC